MVGQVAHEEGSGFVEEGMTLLEWMAMADEEDRPPTPQIEETTRSGRDACTIRRPRTI